MNNKRATTEQSYNNLPDLSGTFAFHFLVFRPRPLPLMHRLIALRGRLWIYWHGKILWSIY